MNRLTWAKVAIAVVFLLLVTPSHMTDAALGAPTLVLPALNTTLPNLSVKLAWKLPAGATQVHLTLTPANGDGPGLNIIQNAIEEFTVPAPPTWSIMLPDMGYTWRVRATDKSTFAPENDPEWSGWSTVGTFRTPPIISSGLTAVSPTHGQILTSQGAVTLQWQHSNPAVFYYEIQVSGDATFNVNPETATSFVWWNLVHGGVTQPRNSWTTPPLQPGTLHYWRVRPRVQGDGKAVDWSSAFAFETPAKLTELITNGDFEKGPQGWSDDCHCIPTIGVGGIWPSGSRGAYLKPVDGQDYGMVSQTVTIPANALSADLTYKFRFGTTDRNAPNDCFAVGKLVDQVITTIKRTCLFSSAFDWEQGFADLLEHRGKQVELVFAVITNYKFVHPTTVYLDDVSVKVR